MKVDILLSCFFRNATAIARWFSPAATIISSKGAFICSSFHSIGPTVTPALQGHRIKNPRTKTFQELRKIPLKMAIIISGTPIQNNLLEFHALFDFVNPVCCSPWRKVFKFTPYYLAPKNESVSWRTDFKGFAQACCWMCLDFLLHLYIMLQRWKTISLIRQWNYVFNITQLTPERLTLEQHHDLSGICMYLNRSFLEKLQEWRWI